MALAGSYWEHLTRCGTGALAAPALKSFGGAAVATQVLVYEDADTARGGDGAFAAGSPPPGALDAAQAMLWSYVHDDEEHGRVATPHRLMLPRGDVEEAGLRLRRGSVPRRVDALRQRKTNEGSAGETPGASSGRRLSATAAPCSPPAASTSARSRHRSSSAHAPLQHGSPRRIGADGAVAAAGATSPRERFVQGVARKSFP
jgi:hypothetical protein